MTSLSLLSFSFSLSFPLGIRFDSEAIAVHVDATVSFQTDLGFNALEKKP